MHGAALLAIAVALVVAPASSRAEDAGPRAFVIGDSLAVGTQIYLPRVLPGWRLEQRVRVGASTVEGVRRVRALAARLPEHLVVSLGTNDDPRNVEAFRRAVRALLASAGPRRCVVWPNIVRPAAHGITYGGFNRVLVEEARRHARLRIVDWAALTRARPEWLRRDRVHATAAGYRARASAIAAALVRCGG